MLLGFFSKASTSSSDYIGHHSSHSSPQCAVCNQPLFHLCTTSSSSTGRPSDRTLSVFCCNDFYCCKNPSSWLVVRRKHVSDSAHKSSSDTESEVDESGHIDNWDDVAFGEDSNPFDLNLTELLGNFSPTPTEPSSSSDQPLKPSEPSVPKCECSNCFPHKFLKFEQVVVNEDYYYDDDVTFEEISDDETYPEGDEDYETDNSDDYFQEYCHFLRSQGHPILQFEPVFPSKSLSTNYSPPPCNCGSSRKFAFQISPTLLSALDVDKNGRNKIMGGVDFSSVIVYECERNCFNEDSVNEFCLVKFLE
ncbi:hypothetical protein GEMRC1_002484 [Eukaryota sp. GEM-RC1]